MWEFCINLSDKNMSISKKLFSNVKAFCNEYDGIVTTFERCNKISILISAHECDQTRFQHFIMNQICDVICSDFKLQFLDENLKLPNLDNISKMAFMQALLSFDKESDRYIVQRFLEVGASIDLEAFYFFKLKPLREKWQELVQIANDNRSYLSSNETLVELLRFLVDNLELKNDTINLVQEKGKVMFYDINFNLLQENDFAEKDIDSTIISNLISLAPKFVNIYCGEQFNSNLLKLLKQIFDKRINFLNMDNILQKSD